MIVGNFKSTADKEAKLSLQKSLLDVEIANEAEREKRQKDFKNPYKAVVVPPQTKSNAELQKDRIEQERQAIANMSELGFDYQKGAELTAWLSSSLINKLVAFNANFKGIKKELVETTNPKLLSLDFLKNYLEKYFEDMDVNYGRKFSRTEQSGTPATSTVDELEQLLPSAENIAKLVGEIEKTNTHLRSIEEELKAQYLDLLQLKEEYVGQADRTIDKRIKMIEKEIGPLTETRRKGYQFIALLQILEAVIPSPELLNLLKQNLTQTERADLIRRYVILLRKAKVMSNAELNEILAYFQGGVRNSAEDIKGVYRRLDSSLGFLTNDAEINSLTKLQRDYEALLSQSGKPINLDSIRKYAEVRDIEIEKAREAFMNAGFYEGPEFDGGEDLGRIKRMKTELELQDAIRAPNLRARDAYDAPPIRTRIDKFGNVHKVGDEGVPENKIIATMQADDEAQAFRDLEEQTLRKTYRGRAEVKATIGDIRELKKAVPSTQFSENIRQNLKDNAERMITDVKIIETNNERIDVLKQILTRSPINMPADNEALVQTTKGPDKETKKDYMDRLQVLTLTLLEQFYDSLSPEQLKLYEPVYEERAGPLREGERLPLALKAPHNITFKGKTTQKEYGYGIKQHPDPTSSGIKKTLQDHFKEDKKYLTKQASKAKDIKKIISQHIMETEPIEEKIDSALGGKGALGFKHTRIKVGKGITAVEQPQYKTFGKYVIHYGHLIDRNIANFKYPSLGGIPAIKPLNISEDYKEFLIDTINTGKANERTLKRLPEEEQKHFEKVVIGAGLLETFNLKRGYSNGDEKKDSDRFTLLRGEVMAGNNNDKLLKELRLLIIKLMGNGRISRSEGTNMLIELSAI